MKYTIGQAARLTGRSKATISRAIKAGKLEATESRGPDTGLTPKWIDREELFRLFPPRPKDPSGERA